MTIGVDVGGTFTDIVRWEGERLSTAKLPTTRPESRAIADGFRRLAGGDGPDRLLLHGTTIATNALLERRGARTVLLTDAGFEDLVEIGRQDRPSLYDPMADRPAPLVERDQRYGWVAGMDLSSLLAGAEPESVAVALLNSYLDGATELELAREVEGIFPGVPISISHRISGEFREYERFSTTILNAYLQPPVATYLRALDQTMAALVERILVMRSSGGLAAVDAAAELAASVVLSGPAAGVVAAAACGSFHGWKRVVSFDMGGTSTDVCRIEDGQPEVGAERAIGGIVCRLPSVAVHTIGAGGGSIGWRDPGGALRVGPHSAGAIPGPASYGQGGFEPSVTDANLINGHLGVETRLAGGILLNVEAATVALAKVGEQLGLDHLAMASGILEVVDALMERAIRKVSIEQGADPRQAPLLAFGGAGGLHATALARRLDMPAVLIPPHAGVFSALGLLLSPVRHDVARTAVMLQGDPELRRRIAEIVAAAAAGFSSASGTDPDRVELSADLRYPGQAHETNVGLEPGDSWEVLAQRFHRTHFAHNGFSRPDRSVELVTLRAAALSRPLLTWDALSRPDVEGEARRGSRSTPHGMVDRWWRPGLGPGDEVVGPAVIEEPQATTWIGEGERALVGEDGTLEVTW